MGRKFTLSVHSMTLVDDVTGEETPITMDDLPEEDLGFVCIGCGLLKPYEEGAADDMPDHCDTCWNAAHYPKETYPLTDEVYNF